MTFVFEGTKLTAGVLFINAFAGGIAMLASKNNKVRLGVFLLIVFSLGGAVGISD